MDAAMQALNVTNQAVVYDLSPEPRSRITTIYVTSMFAGAALGFAPGSQIYGRYGWAGAAATSGACALAVVAGAIACRRYEHTTTRAGAHDSPQDPATVH